MPSPDPDFNTRMEAIATSSFSTKSSLDALSSWLELNKWRGELRITYAGNGGRTSVSFTEKVSMTEAEYHHGFTHNGNGNGHSNPGSNGSSC